MLVVVVSPFLDLNTDTLKWICLVKPILIPIVVYAIFYLVTEYLTARDPIIKRKGFRQP
jgi:hypothetical protein